MLKDSRTRKRHDAMDPQEVFKEAVKEYIAVHDQLNETSKQLKDVRKKKTELAEVILEFMKANDIDECALQDGKLVRKESKRVEGVKKEHILGELRKVVDESRAGELLDNIFNNRAVTTRDSLTRSKTKKKA
jgi:hypothetical protein